MSATHETAERAVRKTGTRNLKLDAGAALEKLQRETFGYFLHETNPVNGLVIDKTAPDWPASITATGLALACYPVAVERGVPYGPDGGTLAPWAVAASLPFAPEIVLPTIDRCIHQARLTQFNAYGFKASFNPSHPGEPGNPYGCWVSPWHCGLNQGPVVLMIENHRSGLLWRLMRACPPVATGLRRAGFTGGWLQDKVATDPATSKWADTIEQERP